MQQLACPVCPCVLWRQRYLAGSVLAPCHFSPNHQTPPPQSAHMYTLWVSVGGVGVGWAVHRPCVCVNDGGGVGASFLSSDIFFLWPVCLYVHMVQFASAHVVRVFVAAIILIDTEKAQMHAIVIIGRQLIFSP